eukprot:TRINITY_DN2587_c0_g1_i19.p1 TRINITY_DN2587_c0_g1~~TRINITY_DN2587_c0_g1_i19.p1  ORF type:complete len:219 (+),score=29.81 TRINITY_DN2587_c0_g1_i19:202-858(+)
MEQFMQKKKRSVNPYTVRGKKKQWYQRRVREGKKFRGLPAMSTLLLILISLGTQFSAFGIKSITVPLSDINQSCQYQTTCYECTYLTTCGWCGNATGRCLPGTDQGPIGHICSDWYFGEKCSEKSCRQHQDCNSCIQSGCYYCYGRCGFYSEGDSCCTSCDACFVPVTPSMNEDMVETFSVIFLVCCATFLGFTFITSSVYCWWKYYWSRRHYFEVLH